MPPVGAAGARETQIFYEVVTAAVHNGTLHPELPAIVPYDELSAMTRSRLPARMTRICTASGLVAVRAPVFSSGACRLEFVPGSGENVDEQDYWPGYEAIAPNRGEPQDAYCIWDGLGEYDGITEDPEGAEVLLTAHLIRRLARGERFSFKSSE